MYMTLLRASLPEDFIPGPSWKTPSPILTMTAGEGKGEGSWAGHPETDPGWGTSEQPQLQA